MLSTKPSRWTAALLVVTALTGATGVSCTFPGLGQCKQPQIDYFTVRYRIQDVLEQPRAEVRQSERFSTLRTTWNTVAIRRPDACANETAGQATGAFTHETGEVQHETMLGTDCGFWLAEVERGLAKNKFTVVSWKSLEQVEKKNQVPSYVAARQLGRESRGQNVNTKVEYFESNANGDRGEPLEVSETENKGVTDFMKPLTKSMRSQKWFYAVKTVLDITAVDTRTGEAVWFYVKQQVCREDVPGEMNFLFGHYPIDDSWWPVTPKWLIALRREKRATRSASSFETEYQRKPQPEQWYKQHSDELTRSVIDDFLSHFRSEGG